jgi:hypothetical protein
MEKLLDQADALILTAGEDGPVRPNFDIPVELAHFTLANDMLQLMENPNKGKGWFAKQPLKAGSCIMVAKPIAWVLDYEADFDDKEEASMDDDSTTSHLDSSMNDSVVLEVLKSIKKKPSIWIEQISMLYPRDSTASLPAWKSEGKGISDKFQSLIRELESIPDLRGKSQEIARRLPLIIRYNVLSVETCPELLSYPGPTGHSSLAGVGLYHLPSFFNHDARPNISRYAVGDIMWFVANQDIPLGHELCISYLEHDVLCESAFRRNCMLSLDFKEKEGPNESNLSQDGPNIPVVDIDVQMELMEMIPFQRLDAIEELLQQAAGQKAASEAEEGMDTDAGRVAWFQCDIQNLRILKAITLESLGQSTQALNLWEESVRFAESSMPPYDESAIVMRVQAALCSWQINEEARAKEHASVALNFHNVMFGGGVARFRRRYMKEFYLNLRKEKDSVEKILWPQ